MPKNLKRVDLTDLVFVCATYCMRRIGYRGSIYDFLSIVPDKYLDTYSYEDVAIGDILIWETNEPTCTPALEIIDATIISSFIKLDKHYAVYEGNDLVSDTTLIGDMQIPNIRCRRLSHLKYRPDGIIRKI